MDNKRWMDVVLLKCAKLRQKTGMFEKEDVYGLMDYFDRVAARRKIRHAREYNEMMQEEALFEFRQTRG